MSLVCWKNYIRRGPVLSAFLPPGPCSALAGMATFLWETVWELQARSQGWCQPSGAGRATGHMVSTQQWLPPVCIGISSLRGRGREKERLKLKEELFVRGPRSAEGFRRQVMQWWPRRGTSRARPNAFSRPSGEHRGLGPWLGPHSLCRGWKRSLAAPSR